MSRLDGSREYSDWLGTKAFPDTLKLIMELLWVIDMTDIE